MDKTDKFLNKLSGNESVRVLKTIDDILSKKAARYDLKKLKGYHDVYRVRIGTIRIIYRQLADDIEVLDVSRRNEKTYRDY
jgi:mRNA-degrading endonuclease RelE of RelBE toxin-antitoxin system